MTAEDLNTMKMKPNTLHRNNEKNALKASQELAKPHPLQGQGYKTVKSFWKILPWEKSIQVSCTQGCLGTCFTMFTNPGTQGPLQLRFGEVQSLFPLAKFLSSFTWCWFIHMMLLHSTCRMQELWSHRGFHHNFKEKSGRPEVYDESVSLWEAQRGWCMKLSD